MYVALRYSNNELGRTILCDAWGDAIDACLMLSAENREPLTEDQIRKLKENGQVHLHSFGKMRITASYHIGKLEEF